jgi:autotransporter-associated beta strand protein
MKTKFSFSKKPHTSLLLATATLLLLSMQCGTFADDASWISLGSTDWNTNGNWLTDPAGGGYPGTTAGNTATFRDLSTVTSLFVSSSPANSIAAINFNAIETHSFTITVNAGVTLTLSGTGITNNSGITQNFVTAVNGAGFFGIINFFNSATAGSMTSFTNNGAIRFFNSSTAGSATITNNGSTVSGTLAGGFTVFITNSTADSATLIANGGTAAGAGGGSIFFFNNSTGGTASVDVRNNGTGAAGNLDISSHNAPGVTIGSLEGSGNVFLGANNLTVGSNNTSKTFSGVIQDGGIGGGTGGSLTKTGTGAFTLTGANIYTGGTTVNAGSLFVNTPKNFTDSGTGTGAVMVNAGATLGGSGTIGGGVIGHGAVTVNSGATLAPGPTGNGTTGILNTGDLTLASGSTFSVDLEGPVAGTGYDQVFVTGAVSILNANLALGLVSGLSVGDNLFIVESTGAVTGTFFGLADGTTFTQDGVTFTIDYYPSGALGGNVELTVDRVTAVPEPTTWIGGALAIPFIGFVYIQRRRRAQMLRRA